MRVPIGDVGDDQAGARPRRAEHPRADGVLRRGGARRGRGRALPAPRAPRSGLCPRPVRALESGLKPARRYQLPPSWRPTLAASPSDHAVLQVRRAKVYALRKFARRHRVMIAAAVVLVTLVAATVVSLLSATLSDTPRPTLACRRSAPRKNFPVPRHRQLHRRPDERNRPRRCARPPRRWRDLLDDHLQGRRASLRASRLDLTVRHTIGAALDALGDPVAAIAQLQKSVDANAGAVTRDDRSGFASATLAEIFISAV